jgi:uncharacterized protein YqeY
MTQLKARLRADLTNAMRGRDELTTATLRMVLTAVSTEEVAGAQARELTDAEVLRVLAREAKKRREAAAAFTAGGRPERAEREQAEGEVVERYLPGQLSGAEITALVRAMITETGADSLRQMGVVVRAVQASAEGRADGKRVADEVRRQLGG